MTRFQLVFRSATGDVSEMRDNSASGYPLFDGVELIDGAIFGYRGQRWLATREDLDGMVRFVCTPADQDHTVGRSTSTISPNE